MRTLHKSGMLVGYARVSTEDQNLDLQKDALQKAGCEKLFTDIASGAKDERAGLAEATAFLRPGDTLAVWKLDRLGRSLEHRIETVTTLQAKKIGFRSLQESIDTTTSGGKLIFHVFGALEELDAIISDEILGEVARVAERRLCFTEADVTSVDDPDRSW